MNGQSSPSISELLADHSLVTEAINRVVRQAVAQHAQAGQPVATWQDGKVIWIQPHEILSQLSNHPDVGTR